MIVEIQCGEELIYDNTYDANAYLNAFFMTTLPKMILTIKNIEYVVKSHNRVFAYDDDNCDDDKIIIKVKKKIDKKEGYTYL